MAKVVQILSDDDLLQLCSMDDCRAFNLLFDRYAPKLYKLGMRYLKDQCAVEELAIDLLYNIWERRHTLQIQGQFSSYLFRAMHNTSISYLRKTKMVTVSIDDFHEDSFQSDTAADDAILAKDTEKTYREKLSGLSPQRRKVFVMSREHNMSYADIARELNLSQNTVENHMVAALSFLRKQYDQYPAFIILSVSTIVFL